jgi:hypothetical protein
MIISQEAKGQESWEHEDTLFVNDDICISEYQLEYLQSLLGSSITSTDSEE